MALTTVGRSGKGDGFSETVIGDGAVAFKGGSDTFNDLTLRAPPPRWSDLAEPHLGVV